MTTPRAKKGPIVIIEDDFDVREALVEVLGEEGYTLQPFASGVEALDAMPQMHPAPALILLDLMMPKMNGWQFREAQRQSPALANIPTVILSADTNVAQNLEDLAAEGYLRKPIHIKTLLALIGQFLRENSEDGHQP